MEIPITELLGKTIQKIIGGEIGSERIRFDTTDGLAYQLIYHQD